MNTTTHRVRHQFTDNGNMPHAPVTLPAIPGIAISNDRTDTAPHGRTIRAHTMRHRQPSQERKFDALVHAICAARAEVLPPVTDAFGGVA